MEKAYDVKALVQKLEAGGLHLAEEGAKSVVEGVFDWVHESAQLSPSPYDDLIDSAVLPKVKAIVLAELDKIDGKVGQ